MNSFATPPIPPHFHEQQRLSPSRSMATSTPTSKKRKASPEEDEMRTSPYMSNARLPHTLAPSNRKRARPNLTGRPLNLDRLLETLDKESLSNILRSLSQRHINLRDEIVSIAPQPTIESTIHVLRQYYQRLIEAFPLDPNPKSDYCHDRVRPQWQDLLDAMTDFTPQFLPPNESQSIKSLEYLDAITKIIHDLPEWDTVQYNQDKRNAYEEISKAWSSVIKEAGKRAGGIQLHHGGWADKLGNHNQRSGGLLQNAYDDLTDSLGWIRSNAQAHVQNQHPGQSIREQLFLGTYGTEQPVMRTGNW